MDDAGPDRREELGEAEEVDRAEADPAVEGLRLRARRVVLDRDLGEVSRPVVEREVAGDALHGLLGGSHLLDRVDRRVVAVEGELAVALDGPEVGDLRVEAAGGQGREGADPGQEAAEAEVEERAAQLVAGDDVERGAEGLVVGQGELRSDGGVRHRERGGGVTGDRGTLHDHVPEVVAEDHVVARRHRHLPLPVDDRPERAEQPAVVGVHDEHVGPRQRAAVGGRRIEGQGVQLVRGAELGGRRSWRPPPRWRRRRRATKPGGPAAADWRRTTRWRSCGRSRPCARTTYGRRGPAGRARGHRQRRSR